MLTLAEQALISNENTLASLDVLLDTEKAKEFFQSQLLDCQLTNLSRQYLRYKPQTNCLVQYELQTNKGTFNAYAKTFGADSESKLAKARQKDFYQTEISHGNISDSSLNIVANIFPNDLRLKAIGKLLDENQQTRLLKNIVSDRSVGKKHFVELLAYKPERRLACKIESEDGFKRLIKFHSPSRFTDVVAKNILLTNISNIRTHKCLSYSDKFKALSFSWIEGDNLYELIEKELFSPEYIIELGKLIAILHSSAINTALPKVKNSSVTSRINTLTDTLRVLLPSRINQLNEVRDTLCNTFNSTHNYVINHGDFHAKQIIVNSNHVSLIDWDNTQLDHAMADIGLFFAHLDVKVIRKLLKHNTANNIKEWFKQGYNSVRHQADYSDLNYYYAFGLLQLAHHPFRNLCSDWDITTKIIIDRCFTTLNRNTKKSSHKVYLAPVKTLLNKIEVTSTRLLDKELVSYILSPYFKQYFHADESFNITDAKLIKERKRKRCVVKYQIQIQNNDLEHKIFSCIAKCRYKSLDKRSYVVAKALYEDGLNESALQYTKAPKPLFIVPELNLWIQEYIEAKPTWDYLDSTGGTEVAKVIANACFDLHYAHPVVANKHDKYQEFEILTKQLDSLISHQPFYKKRIKRILAACREIIEELDDDCSVGIHRDFYPDQILINNENAYLIDFDLYTNGHPAIDLGNFIAHLEEWSLRTKGSAHYLETQARAFVYEYIRISNRNLLHETHLYKILSLARLIAVSMRIPDRIKNVPHLINLVERYLNIKPVTNSNNFVAIH